MADPFELLVEEEPDPEHVCQLVDGLVAYNRSRAEAPDRQPLGVFLRVRDQILGGANGYTHWRWLYVSHLWIDGTHRRQGAGRQVMAMMDLWPVPPVPVRAAARYLSRRER